MESAEQGKAQLIRSLTAIYIASRPEAIPPLQSKLSKQRNEDCNSNLCAAPGCSDILHPPGSSISSYPSSFHQHWHSSNSKDV